MSERVAFLHEDQPLPDRVTLFGIGFNVTESEGLIVFSEAVPVYGMGCRFSFHRDSSGSWEVRIDAHCREENPSMSPSRLCMAFEVVQKCRGDSFGRPYPLPDGWSDSEWSKLRWGSDD